MLFKNCVNKYIDYRFEGICIDEKEWAYVDGFHKKII